MNRSHKSTGFRKRFAQDNLLTAEKSRMPGPRNWLINNRKRKRKPKKKPNILTATGGFDIAHRKWEARSG